MSIKSLKKIFVLGRDQGKKIDEGNRSPETFQKEMLCSQENQNCANSPKVSFPNQNKHGQQGLGLEQYKGVNQILKWEGVINGLKKEIYYLPASLRLQVNRVNRIDYMGCSAQLDVSIYLWIMMKDFPKSIQEQIIDTGQLKINGQRNISLRDIVMRKNNTQSSENMSKKVMPFFTRIVLTMEISTDNFLSPFELVNIQGFLELRDIELSELSNEEKIIGINFNFMETEPFLHFRFNQLRNLGNYELAQGRVALKFSNQQNFGKMKFSVDKAGEIVEEIILPNFIQSKCKKQQKTQKQIKSDDPPNPSKNATIIISLYKYPMATLFTVFVPFYLLSLLCLGVFFTGNIMSMRSLTIFLLLMSYMSMIPAIRSMISATPFLIMIQILVYLQSLCIVAIFIQSIQIRNLQDYVFDWSTDLYFLFVLAFTIINLLFVITLCFVHKCYWEPSYNRLTAQTREKINKKFNTDEWFNDLCQKQFHPYLQHGVIQFVFPTYRDSLTNMFAKSTRNIKKKVTTVTKKIYT